MVTAQILEAVMSDWPALGLGPLPPGRNVRWLALDGFSAASKLVCPCWVGDDPLPRVIVKFARKPGYNVRLDAERSALVELERFSPRASPRLAPRSLAALDVAGLRVTVETALPGGPLYAYLQAHPRRALSLLAAWEPLAFWLTEVHVRSARPATAEELDRLLSAPLSRVPAELDITDGGRQALDRLATQAHELSVRHPLMLVFNHNDLGPPNLLCSARGLFSGAVDWEAGGFGLPATDLIYFLARFIEEAYRAAGRGGPGGFESAFFRSGPLPGGQGVGAWNAVVRAWLARYCRQLGLASDWLPVLFGLCWVMHARNERRQASERAGYENAPGGPSASAQASFLERLSFYLENVHSLAVEPASGGTSERAGT